MTDESEEFKDFLDELIQDIMNVVERYDFTPSKESIEQAYIDLYTKYRPEYLWTAELDDTVINMTGTAFIEPDLEWITINITLPEEEEEDDK